MDDADASIYEQKSSVIFDHSVIARRKRMEIRKFKKFASSTQLLNNDSVPLKGGELCLKRPRLGQASMECDDSASDTHNINVVPSILHTEEGKFPSLPNGKEASMLNSTGIPRHDSLPPENVLISKARRSGPDTDVDRGPSGESKGHLAGLSPITSELQIANLSSSEATHGLSPVRILASGSMDSLCHALSECNFPPSGKLLVCGRRREMEDTAMIAPSFTQIRRDAAGSCLCDGSVEDRALCDFHFFAVYDGHGGSQASNFCMENLHHALAEELSSLHEDEGKPSGRLCSPSAWERAMISCFSKMDREVGGVCPNGGCHDAGSPAICCNNSIAPENVGTTAVVAVVSLCQIVVANCGDSRAVLSRGGMAIPLSRDHKPQRDDECSRIEAAGGQVIDWDGHRVVGLLALSRAIGDRYLKRYVISKPEVACLQRTKEDECLILASDGLWDVITNETACEIARKGLHSSRKMRVAGSFALGEDPACAAVAALLIKLAYGRGSDNGFLMGVVGLSKDQPMNYTFSFHRCTSE